MKLTKKTAKILNIVLIALAIVMVLNSVVLAATPGDQGYKDITAQDSELQGSIANIGGSLLGIAQTIGMVVAVIFVIVVAIKYIGSSPNDKAQMKQNMVMYIVGAVVLFGASGLVGLIRTWTTSTIK